MKWETPEALVAYLRASPTSDDRLAAADMIEDLRAAHKEAVAARLAAENRSEVLIGEKFLALGANQVLGESLKEANDLVDKRQGEIIALRDTLRTAREYVAEALAHEKDAYKGFEHVSDINEIERDLARIDAALLGDTNE